MSITRDRLRSAGTALATLGTLAALLLAGPASAQNTTASSMPGPTQPPPSGVIDSAPTVPADRIVPADHRERPAGDESMDAVSASISETPDTYPSHAPSAERGAGLYPSGFHVQQAP